MSNYVYKCSKVLWHASSLNKLLPLNDRHNFGASAGNRTRAARVAGEHSTTEPPMRKMLASCPRWKLPCHLRFLPWRTQRLPMRAERTIKATTFMIIYGCYSS
ncbi:hypothetical protein V3C99_002345 [Haemonchus contortus]